MEILLMIYVVAVIILSRVMATLHEKGEHKNKGKVALALIFVNVIGAMLVFYM